MESADLQIQSKRHSVYVCGVCMCVWNICILYIYSIVYAYDLQMSAVPVIVSFNTLRNGLGLRDG